MFGLTTLGTIALALVSYLVWWAITRAIYSVYVGAVLEREVGPKHDVGAVFPVLGEITFSLTFLSLCIGIPLETLTVISSVAKSQKKLYTLKTKEVQKEEGQLSIPPAELGAVSIHDNYVGYTGQPP
jgi:hypothetical protein